MVKHEKFRHCLLPFGSYTTGWTAATALYQSQFIRCQRKIFFRLAARRGVNSPAIDDPTQPGGKSHGFMARGELGWVLPHRSVETALQRPAKSPRLESVGFIVATCGGRNGPVNLARPSGLVRSYEQAPAAGIMQRGRTAASSEPRQIRRSANRTRCQHRGRTDTLPVPRCPRVPC
jgi:hypothetical protein